MASYKIYFLNFCHLNHSPAIVVEPAKLHFAILRACFIEKVVLALVFGVKSP